MFFVYILQSEKSGKYYTGHTGDISKRLTRHNKGRVNSTKHFMPWNLIHLEKFDTKQAAYKREMEIKSFKSGIKFKNLLKLI